MPHNNETVEHDQAEAYRLSEMLSIIPEFKGDQISLGAFLNSSNCAYNMASSDQQYLLTIHIENRPKDRAAKLSILESPIQILKSKNYQLFSLDILEIPHHLSKIYNDSSNCLTNLP